MYYSINVIPGDQIKNNEMGGAGNDETRFWWGKPEGTGTLARPCNRCEYNITMDITDTGLEVVDWINLA